MPKGLISIRCEQTESRLTAEMAEFLDAPVIDIRQEPQTEFLLEIKNEQPSLIVVGQSKLKPFQLDFNVVRPGSGKDPLLRAIGSKTRSVVDVTAGWCSDALHIARQGKEVTAVEQNRIVQALVNHAAQYISDPGLKSRFKLVGGNGSDFLESLALSPDVIYLDPMYPENNKNAMPRKELIILRQLAGDAGNNQRLFDCAMTLAKKRVVVKRPHYAEPMALGKVGETRSKLVRFDIYKPDGR
jgi:16S rRNA (guanine1516-N2)-methyltransferase